MKTRTVISVLMVILWFLANFGFGLTVVAHAYDPPDWLVLPTNPGAPGSQFWGQGFNSGYGTNWTKSPYGYNDINLAYLYANTNNPYLWTPQQQATTPHTLSTWPLASLRGNDGGTINGNYWGGYWAPGLMNTDGYARGNAMLPRWPYVPGSQAARSMLGNPGMSYPGVQHLSVDDMLRAGNN